MRTLRRLLLCTALLCGVFLGRACDSLREDELHCEEAALRIRDCCGSDVAMDCTYVVGCESGQRNLPVLDIPSALCVRDASCQALRDAGVCDVATWQLPGTCTATTKNQTSADPALLAACAKLEVLSCWR